MDFYIDKEGKLSKFERYPLVAERFEVSKKNLNLFGLQQVTDTVNDFKSCSHILFLHPKLKGNFDSIADTIFCHKTNLSLGELYGYLKHHDCYLVVCKVVHDIFRTYAEVLVLETVEYDSSIRKFYIDEFIENN